MGESPRYESAPLSRITSKPVLQDRTLDSVILGTPEKPYEFLSGREIAEWMTEICSPNLIAGRVIRVEGIGLDESDPAGDLGQYGWSPVADSITRAAEWHIDSGPNVLAGELVATLLLLNDTGPRFGETEVVKGSTFLKACTESLPVPFLDKGHMQRSIIHPQRTPQQNLRINANIDPQDILSFPYGSHSGIIIPNHFLDDGPDWLHRYRKRAGEDRIGQPLTRLYLLADRKRSKWNPIKGS